MQNMNSIDKLHRKDNTNNYIYKKFPTYYSSTILDVEILDFIAISQKKKKNIF